jgi:dynein light intermediate chain, axonemal
MSTRPQQIPRESLIQFEPPIESSESRQHLNANMESKPSTEDILNAILPPRRWEQESRFYLQYVSHNPASREDVANLQKLLDERLLAR